MRDGDEKCLTKEGFGVNSENNFANRVAPHRQNRESGERGVIELRNLCVEASKDIPKN